MPFLSFLIERFIRPAQSALAPVRPAPASRLSLDAQMMRLADAVAASHERSTNSGRYHAAAEDQLDAAAYALKELIRDLSAVMTVPTARAGAALYHLPAVSAPAATRRRASAA